MPAEAIPSSADPRQDEPDAVSLLEIARARKGPYFYIIDARLRVLFEHVEPAFAAREQRLPADVAATASRLLDASAYGAGSAVALLERDLVLRLMRLGAEGEPHYALFLEPYQVRDLLSTAAKRYGFTARENDVMGLVLRGMSTSQIAARLHISETTVQQHVKNVGAKIGVPTRKAIVGAILGSR